MAHPHVASPILLLSLYTSQDSRHITSAPWCISRVEALAVTAIGDIDTFVARNRMGVYGRRRMNTVLPFFLHLSMHH